MSTTQHCEVEQTRTRDSLLLNPSVLQIMERLKNGATATVTALDFSSTPPEIVDASEAVLVDADLQTSEAVEKQEELKLKIVDRSEHLNELVMRVDELKHEARCAAELRASKQKENALLLVREREQRNGYMKEWQEISRKVEKLTNEEKRMELEIDKLEKQKKKVTAAPKKTSGSL